MRKTTLEIEYFRESVRLARDAHFEYQENFFRLVEDVRNERLTPMTARQLMLDAGMRWQRVNEVFRLARLSRVEYRRWRERFIGFQAAESTVGKQPKFGRRAVANPFRGSKRVLGPFPAQIQAL